MVVRRSKKKLVSTKPPRHRRNSGRGVGGRGGGPILGILPYIVHVAVESSWIAQRHFYRAHPPLKQHKIQKRSTMRAASVACKLLFALQSAARFCPTYATSSGDRARTASLLPTASVSNRPFSVEVPAELVKPPIRIAPVYALHLANGTHPGVRVVQLRHPCVELGPLSILGLAVESANEEFAQLADACSAESCTCLLRSPLRFVRCHERPLLLVCDSMRTCPFTRFLAPSLSVFSGAWRWHPR
jgi:hypothetical protein